MSLAGLNYSSNDISFEYENGGGNITVDKSGHVTLSGSKVGTYTGVVVSMYGPNNVKLGSSAPFTITVEEAASSVVSRTNDKTLALNSKVDNWNSDQSFKDLYTGDKTVILWGKMDRITRKVDWEHKKDTILSNLKELGSEVVEVLSTAGLDSAKLRTAANNVAQRYYNEGAIKYKNDNGKDRSDLKNHCIEYMTQNRESTKSRIVWTIDEDGRDSSVF